MLPCKCRTLKNNFISLNILLSNKPKRFAKHTAILAFICFCFRALHTEECLFARELGPYFMYVSELKSCWFPRCYMLRARDTTVLWAIAVVQNKETFLYYLTLILGPFYLKGFSIWLRIQSKKRANACSFVSLTFSNSLDMVEGRSADLQASIPMQGSQLFVW